MKGTPTSIKNPCPVCGNFHGCKIQENKWVLCLRGSSKQDTPPGYRFVKPLRNGMGGLWVADAGHDTKNEAYRAAWRQERDIKRILRDQELAQRQAKLLSIEERDAQYRLVNQDLTLIARHRQVLRERGLADTEVHNAVELGALRTWNPGQRIMGISADLAGVDPFTRALTGVDGIAIYAFDPDGFITGAQVKTDSGTPGKYIWLSSQRQRGNGPQLPNGELPLFVWLPPEADQISKVILCEGALKSALTALMLWRMGLTDIAVIGTAAAGHYGAHTLKDYLERLAPLLVMLAPDAGAIKNVSNIPAANNQTIKWCQEWGYSVEVLWWGQSDKQQHLDIDELLVAGRWNEVQALTPDEFFQLHPESTRARLTDATPQDVPGVEASWSEPDANAYAQYVAWEKELEHNEEIAAEQNSKRRKREWRERLERELNPHPDAFVWGQKKPEAPDPRSLWQLGYKPSITVHQRYLSLEGIDANFLCLISAMNTGKTQALAQMVSDSNVSVLLVTNTISLAEALAVRYKCRCYNEDDINLGEVTRLVITADSLWRVPTLNKRFDVVIIDEADQVTSHLTTGFTCKRNRERILAVFSYFAATAGRYILADADLSGVVIDWHTHLRGSAPFILKNTYKPNQDRFAYQFSSQEAAFEYGCQMLEAGRRVLFCCDSKTTVKKSGAMLSGIDSIEGIENLPEALALQLVTRFPDKKGQVVHGDNSGKAEIRKFIKNINTVLKFRPLDYLIYNSTIQSGVSIDFEAFDEVICLFSGFTLAHTELGQLAHRYRPDVTLSFWVNSKPRKGLETNCYSIAGDFLRHNHADGLSLKIDPNTGMVGIEHPEFLQLVASLNARRNWSLMNIESGFKSHLEQMGYEIEPHPDEEFLTGLKFVKSELKQRRRIVSGAEIATICVSPEITPQQHELLKNKPNPDFYERCTVQKFELHDFYGMDVTPELIEADDVGQRRRKLTRLELLLNPESMARRMDLSDRRTHHVITDLKHHKLARDLLCDLGMLEFIDPKQEYSSKELIGLGERARAKALDIKKILGITICVAPRYLKDCRILAHKALRAVLIPRTHLDAKWVFFALVGGITSSVKAQKFQDQEKADYYCSQLSPLAQLICEALAVEKRFCARETSDSQVHATLCDAVGLKRQMSRFTREGRFYQITSSSWEQAIAVLAHRQQQRETRLMERELAVEVSAKRFQHLTSGEMQSKISAQIKDNHNIDAPALVFLAEWWIKLVMDLGDQVGSQELDAPALVLFLSWWIKFATAPGKPDGSSHPPNNISIYDFLEGGVTKSQSVAPGQEVRLLPLALEDFAAKPLTNQLVDGQLVIEQLATGRNSTHEFHDYLRIKPLDGESYWVPAEWVESHKGLPVRRDPDAYAPRIPSSTLRTWRNWLLDVRTSKELEKFERHRQPSSLQAIVDSLASDQVSTLQQRFSSWGIQRDWLPAVAESEQPVTASQIASPPATDSATASPPKEAPIEQSATIAADCNVNTTNDESGGWLPAEVCVFGRWIAGFWRHVTTGEWCSPHGTVPLITPKEWRWA